MAKVVMNIPFLDEIKGSLGKKKKLGIPLTRLDLQILSFGKKIVLGKKAFPPQRATILQRQTRERFKEADCIYWRMSQNQKNAVYQWGQDLELKYRYKLKPYHYFMQRVLTNYVPELLQSYFCLDLDDLTVEETDTEYIIYTRLIHSDTAKDPLKFFERIARRY